MSAKAQPKRYRWSCASPDHPGILAPSRLRRIDLRRYCIPCSEASGVLVERTSAALEKKRETKTDQRKAKAKRQTQTRKKRRDTSTRQRSRRQDARATAITEAVGDLDAQLKRIWPIVRDVSPRDDLPVAPPAMKVTLRTRESFVSGYAWYHQHRIHIGVPRSADHSEGCGTLAHELAHLAAADRELGHHAAFWIVLVDIVCQAYGTVLTPEEVLSEPTKYLRQQVVEQAIRDARASAGV